LLAEFFVDRPIFATVISVVIVLAGGVAVLAGVAFFGISVDAMGAIGVLASIALGAIACAAAAMAASILAGEALARAIRSASSIAM